VASALRPTKQGTGTEIHYVSLGVAAVISPWNYPLAMTANLIIRALIAGNSVIFKPSPETPLVANEMVATLYEHLPKNLLQIVYGDNELGQQLVESDINLITFTGSKDVGKDIMARASSGLKRLVTELGGNDPMIVTADADLEIAAQCAVGSSFKNAGQMCVSTERVYVDALVAKKFEQKVKQLASHYAVGAWNDPRANIGPVVNHQQFDKITAHVNDAIAKGANLLLGDTNATSPFFAPTVISDITPSMIIETQEALGPVVAIAQYTDINEAIKRANDTEYGLGAVVFGAKGASQVAAQLEAGMVGVNHGDGDSPWVALSKVAMAIVVLKRVIGSLHR